MGVVAEDADVLDGVACDGPCSEAGSADVDGIGSVVDGFEAAYEVACRSEQLDEPPGLFRPYQTSL